MYLSWYDIASLPCMWLSVGLTFLLMRSRHITEPQTLALAMVGSGVAVLIIYLVIVIIDNK